ncbi:unnamed protein product [Closterium sp. Naga37s-1]|nr:unnamed protein product [Closterium sp. Naga37s-1]
MFRAMEPRAHTSGGVQLRGFEPPREESALPAEEIRAEPPHPSFSSGDGARVRGMTKMSRRLWGSGRPWSPPRMYSRRLWGSGRPWYPEERGWSTAASRHFTHTVPLHHPSIITSPINIYHSPTQFPHPLLSTTHSFPPPTPFHHPLLSTTHSFPPPTPFPHPLLSPTYSFPPPTNFPNPLVSPTHSFPPPTPFPHPLLSPTHSFPPPTPFPHPLLSPTYTFPPPTPFHSSTHSFPPPTPDVWLYGKESSGLVLDLVNNPVGPFLPPAQAKLEEANKYHSICTSQSELMSCYGISFNQQSPSPPYPSNQIRPYPVIPPHTLHNHPHPSAPLHTPPYPSIPLHFPPYPSIPLHTPPFPSIPLQPSYPSQSELMLCYAYHHHAVSLSKFPSKPLHTPPNPSIPLQHHIPFSEGAYVMLWHIVQQPLHHHQHACQEVSAFNPAAVGNEMCRNLIRFTIPPHLPPLPPNPFSPILSPASPLTRADLCLQPSSSWLRDVFV